MCTTCVSGTHEGQKKVSEHMGLEMIVSQHGGTGKIQIDTGPVGEQSVLLTIDPSLQFPKINS